MKLAEIKEMAAQRGIRSGKMNKADLIRAIQVQESNSPCFGTAVDFCDQLHCLWREDCLKS
jgi:hypothetical protein